MADDGKLLGVAELTAKLKALGALEDGRALRRAVYAGMKPALAAARAKIPVGTRTHRTYKGRLVSPGFAKASLRIVTTVSKDKQAAFALLGPRKEAFYASLYVEIGTAKMAAKPWLRPAFYGSAEAQKEGLADSLQRSVLKIAAASGGVV